MKMKIKIRQQKQFETFIVMTPKNNEKKLKKMKMKSNSYNRSI